jgi:hypothetical protein
MLQTQIPVNECNRDLTQQSDGRSSHDRVISVLAMQ